jgi:hypothetical protein
MWPLEEMDEDERSVDDADIAGTRSTLQPAHHQTSFVPEVYHHDFRGFLRLSMKTRASCALLRDQNVTTDSNSVIERHFACLAVARQMLTGVGRDNLRT